MSCAPLSPDSAYLTGMLTYVDCQAQTLGEGGYRALTSAGGPAAALLSLALILFIALFGYRMLLGQVPGVRDGVLAAVKVGMVLVLATSWPAFRTLVYDVAIHGPAELASAVGGDQRIPGAAGGLVPHLQYLDDRIAALAVVGTGRPPDIVPPATAATEESAAPQVARAQDRPRWNPDRDALMVVSARVLYLTGAIGAFAAVRLLAGLLLALGPLFALFLLFDATRGLFEGWVRALAGAALGAMATTLVLGIQLALMEPWLDGILLLRQQDIPTPRVPVEVLVTALVFDVALVAVLAGIARTAYGFRIARGWQQAPLVMAERLLAAVVPERTVTRTAAVAASAPSRATRIADAVAATQRRELAAGPMPAARIAEAAAAAPRAERGGSAVARNAPLGQSHRRNRSRRSGRAAERDRTP